jgi:DHA1 family tetracycline resistance protein-like MFS transporter
MADEPISDPSGARPAALAFIYVTITLDMLALGLVFPVLPQLVLGFVGGDAATAAEVVGLFSMVWALMQFLCSPLLGAMSDRFGRRPVILISNFGLGLDYILMALAPNLSVLFVGRVIAGITAASISTASAYIADVVPPEKRAGAFGLMSVFFGVGFVFGPAIGGLLGSINPRLPFWVAAGLSLTNAAYGLLVLPESLAPARRGAFHWRRANPVGSLVLLRSKSRLFWLAVVSFIIQVAHSSLPGMFVLYCIVRYGWGERSVGLSFAAIGLCQALVGGLLVKPVVGRLGERAALLAGLGFGMLGFLIIGLAPVGWIMVIGIPVLALWGLAGPALQGLMTRLVDASEQGQLQGGLGSLAGIAGSFAPALFNGAFAFFVSQPPPFHLEGAPYLLAAGLMAAAVTLAFVVTRGQRRGGVA